MFQQVGTNFTDCALFSAIGTVTKKRKETKPRREFSEWLENLTIELYLEIETMEKGRVRTRYLRWCHHVRHRLQPLQKANQSYDSGIPDITKPIRLQPTDPEETLTIMINIKVGS